MTETERTIGDLDPMRVLDAGWGEGFFDAAREVRRRLDEGKPGPETRTELESLETWLLAKRDEYHRRANPGKDPV